MFFCFFVFSQEENYAYQEHDDEFAVIFIFFIKIIYKYAPHIFKIIFGRTARQRQ